MRYEHFDFELPEGRIARQPRSNRDGARLLVVERDTGQLSHHQVRDLPALLGDRFHMVVNDTAVSSGGGVTYPRYLGHFQDHYPDQVPRFYDTVYAETPGSLAPPSAGLNLSEGLLAQLSSEVGLSRLTLHLGHLTYRRPAEAPLRDHGLSGEPFELSAESASAIRRARRAGRRILAVGTSSTRALETIARSGGLSDGGRRGIADIFIEPGHRFGLACYQPPASW